MFAEQLSTSIKYIRFAKTRFLSTGRARRIVRQSWLVPENGKLDSAHLLYLQDFVVQFPGNTKSSEVVSNLNFTGPLDAQDFSAFEPFEQIGKLRSPAKNRLFPGFCSEAILPSNGC